jgi:O-antigen/teichoic acid export membrane protein
MPEIKNMKASQSDEGFASSKSATLVRTAEMAETGDNLINGDKGHDGHNGRKGRIGHLTSGRLLARNTLWNLIGSGAPMVVAFFCIPILIRGLGKERFGVLALAWALIGYASLFDLGLGRALTQLVARKLGVGEDREVPALVWTSLLLMLSLGVVGAAVVGLLSPWLVHRVLNVPGALQHETLQTFYLLGLSIPVIITTAGLRGLLEAHQRFGLINVLRIPMGVFTFAGPLLVLPFSRSLFPIVGILVVGRLIGWAAHLLVCFRVAPELGHRIAWQRAAAGPLLRFGGWMTVTNVVGPLMVTLDRFLIGAMVSMAAVAYYATPYEIVTKLWLIPGALVGVMFPAFSTSFAQNRERTALLYRRSAKYILLILFPIVLLIMVLAADGLKLWLGPEFAQNSTRVLQWLAVGVFINSLAQVPFALVQGIGRPDLTAKLHLIELPFYLFALWRLIQTRGIDGAAIAWTGRVTVDAIVLFCLSRSLLPKTGSDTRRTVLTVAAALVILFMATLPSDLIARMVFLLIVLTAFAAVGWFLLLTKEERAVIQVRLRLVHALN